MKVARAIKKKNVFLDLKSTAKDEVLQEMISRLQESGEITARLAKVAYEAVLAREKMGSTGIGNGIAIPHVKLKGGPEDTMVSIGRSAGGVDFAAVDGARVHVLFLVISRDDRPDDHLAVLKGITAVVRDGYQHRLLLGSRTPDDFIDLFKDEG
jgi:mannitol/fructose-specific phosphotransferase system IIA component (Ntr-type)